MGFFINAVMLVICFVLSLFLKESDKIKVAYLCFGIIVANIVHMVAKNV